jgi:hypothetical protein
MTLFSRIAIGMVAATIFFGLSATPRAKDFIKQERPQQRGYSAAVIMEGGKTVWLAGQTPTVDDYLSARMMPLKVNAAMMASLAAGFATI